ncbi:MAG TPA: PAS domain-containing protein, partial [Steroidobacteraceae bacterium]
MSIIVLLCLLFGVAAILLLVLFSLQRRQLNALGLVSEQVQRIASGDAPGTHIELHTDQPELATMVSAVNHLLGRMAADADRAAAATAPIGSLGDRVHEAVLIHAKTIRYANPQFANLMGCKVGELLGRRLEDLVPADHKDLVADNMRRRLAGEPAAERYEIDLVGVTGQSARLELSTWVVDFEGARALLIVGVEVLP